MTYTHCTTCNKEKTAGSTKSLCKSCVQKGKVQSVETRAKISDSNTGKPKSEEARRKLSVALGGTGVLGKKKYRPGHEKWRKAIKARDGACIDCGSTERLEAHHLVAVAKFPEVATELWNGITLCRKCHIKEHKTIGYR